MKINYVGVVVVYDLMLNTLRNHMSCLYHTLTRTDHAHPHIQCLNMNGCIHLIIKINISNELANPLTYVYTTTIKSTVVTKNQRMHRTFTLPNHPS